jgi:hypothetical protein
LVTSANCFIRVTNGSTTGTSGQFTITVAPSIVVTSPTAGAHWAIGAERDITWTSNGLNNNPLTIILARDGVNFTETITTGLDHTSTHYPWMVTGPGTINAKIRVQQVTATPDTLSAPPFSSSSAQQGDTGGTIDHSAIITNGVLQPGVTEGTSPEFTIAAPPSPPPAGMPSMSPWALALLTLSLLGAGGWWFLRRRRFA